MPKTISFHNGTTWSRGHNIRDERFIKNQKNIDCTLTSNNITLRDIPIRQAYNDIFQDAVEEYNAKQKRSDRKIDSYYYKIKNDKRKHLAYECIVQIGDSSDTGIQAESEKKALIQFANEWDKRNPNLHLIGAYVHCDEYQGTVHMHLDYIPVATCSRGMRIQNSLDRALQQQGFKTENIHETAQIAWQERERETLTAICHELGIDAQHSQGIGHERKYLTPQEYRIAKERQQAEIDKDLQPLREELGKYREFQVSGNYMKVDKKKILLSKRVSVPNDTLEQLEEQARAYRAVKSDIETISKNKEEINSELEKQKSASESLKIQLQQLEERESILKNREDEVKKAEIYIAEQLNDLDIQQLKHKVHNQSGEIFKLQEHEKEMNAFLKQKITELNELTAENTELKDKIQSIKRTNEELQKICEKQQDIDQLAKDIEDYKRDISDLTDKNNTLTKTVDTQKNYIEILKEKLISVNNKLKTSETNIRTAFEMFSCAVKSLNMLTHDIGDYKASLTPKQSRLIEAISKYSQKLAVKYNFSDLAEEMKKNFVSEEIQTEIRKLTPTKKLSR